VRQTLAAARACGAYVLEDAAQALGATQDGQSVGLLGDAGFFSLAVGKGLTLYEGGVLVARDPTLRRAFGESRHAVIRPSLRWGARRAIELLGYAIAYRPSLLYLVYGRPLRKALAENDPVAAVGDDFDVDIPLHPLGRWRQAVGARALKRLPTFLAATRARARQRLDALRALPGVTVFDDASGTQGAWPFLLLTMPDAASRDAALAALWTSGLGVSRLFIHALPDYGYLRGIVPAADLPHARDFAARSLTITNSPWLRDDEFARIVGQLRRALGA
jgi:dTDP-4-amino-4,6-dideoxygalactose transaminase